MPDENWKEIRSLIEGENIELGPYFGHQIRHSPRHILFTLSRYKFAAKMLPQDEAVSLLELGCSEGVGTLMLAERGHKITAVDGDVDAIEHAKRVIDNPNIEFRHANFIGEKFGTFDAVVTLDVIEHIDQRDEDTFLKTITGNLKKDGVCIIGTPNDTASRFASRASQIGHVNMFEAERLIGLLRKHFIHVFLFSMNDEIIHTGFYPMAHYLMAVACTPRN